MTRSELYDLFWVNSSLSDATVPAFRAAIEEYSGAGASAPGLRYGGRDLALNRPSDRAFKQLRRRRSERVFADRTLDARRLGGVLAAFATTGDDGRRAYASAGGTYPLEIFCLLRDCEGPAGGQVAYYNADNHSLAAVCELPPWHDCADALNLDAGGTAPQLVVVFVLFAERMTEKYGERGGRFALIEAGEAAHSLALRLVAEGLAGYALGGLIDERVKRLLRLDGTSAQIALGYACGVGA
jgi:SagB-type dehydrogenase family enzyme